MCAAVATLETFGYEAFDDLDYMLDYDEYKFEKKTWVYIGRWDLRLRRWSIPSTDHPGARYRTDCEYRPASRWP